jgi:hypothetical protein
VTESHAPLGTVTLLLWEGPGLVEWPEGAQSRTVTFPSGAIESYTVSSTRSFSIVMCSDIPSGGCRSGASNRSVADCFSTVPAAASSPP